MTEEPTSNPTATPAPVAAVTAAPVVAPVAAAPQEELIDIDYFMKVQLRVALIEAAEAVPKSKKLIKLQLNLGEKLGKKQILAGVAQFYTPEALIGKKIVVVANLKPAKLMGVESQGMLLAASTEDGSKLIIVDPSADMPPGSVVR